MDVLNWCVCNQHEIAWLTARLGTDSSPVDERQVYADFLVAIVLSIDADDRIEDGAFARRDDGEQAQLHEDQRFVHLVELVRSVGDRVG